MAILPPKVLMAQVVNVNAGASITDSSNPWVGNAYQWQIDILVPNLQAHSDPNSVTPYFYTAQDIEIGDWYCNGVDGAAVQIVTIVSTVDTNHATVIVEDIEYFNIFNDPTQSGFGGPSTGIGAVFSIDDDGQPILMGMAPNTLPDTFATDLMSRFNYRNIWQKYVRVNQPGHTFVVGDIIQPSTSITGEYVLATDTHVTDLSVGTVTDVGTPEDGWFNFEPFGEIEYNVQPPLTGGYGCLYYLDPSNPGKITSTRPAEFARPVYLGLNSTTTAIRFNSVESAASETKTFKMSSITDGETTFTLPSDAFEVVSMLINGIETSNFTYNASTKIVTFDPTGNGYGIDSTDEVTFVYTT